MSELKIAKELWSELSDIPTDKDGCIETEWYIFEKGTDRLCIWHWFEDTFNLSIAEDLMYVD